jgi:peptidyl-prolyl cis-trans isomerase D
MFDAVRNNKRIVQVFLGLITLPFAFWGVDSYMSNIGAGNDLASVGDSKISLYQFEQSLRERQDQLRRSMGAEFKPEMMNLPEVRLGILNNLIDQRLLLLEASDKRLRVSDQALQQFIANIPSFQEDGKFSPSRYEALVRAQSKSPAQFEGELRQDLTLQQLIGSVSASAFVSTTQAEQMLRIQTEERYFSEFKIATAPFAEKLKIEPEAVQKFYDENKVRFEVPEQVKAEYVVLSLEALLPQVTVSEAEINSWINNESNKDRYQQLLVQKPEERRASHILITPDGDAKDGKEKARAKAEDVLKDVQKDPSRFAELARQYSQDPGSAQQGGDLGFFSRGMMVKPFEDAVFSQKKGEISGLVESDFGYHIIKLTDIQEAKDRPQQEVRIEIETE